VTCDDLHLQEKLTEGERRLLKAYDRVFWYHYYALGGAQSGSEQTNEPTQDKQTQWIINKCKRGSVCPFGDPVETSESFLLQTNQLNDLQGHSLEQLSL
jgi:hypothetical protein